MNHQNNLHKKEQLLKQKEAEASKLYNDVKKMRKNRLQVSDHAVVRYLERKYKMDIHKIREEIITPQLAKTYIAIGDGELPVDDNTRAVIKDGVVITILM